ncbi:MAG: hypothetical protein ABI330_04380 [Caldimonas sp.]
MFRRKLLEVLFDGRPEADAQIAAQAKAFYGDLAADRKLLTLPPDPHVVESLAPHSSTSVMGERGSDEGQPRRYCFDDDYRLQAYPI